MGPDRWLTRWGWRLGFAAEELSGLNFDFSDEQHLLREQARRFLADHDARRRSREQLEQGDGFDAELWEGMAELGWLGAVLPEEYGGAGLGYVELCVLAEEIGRANAAVPFTSSIYLTAEAISRFGTDTQKQTWLPRFVTGEAIGAFATAEQLGPLIPSKVRAEVAGGVINGVKSPVNDGREAHVLVVLARNGDRFGLYLVDASDAGVSREPLAMIDGSRPAARMQLNGVRTEPLPVADGWSAVEELQNRAAVLVAFEQVGGAQACLEMGARLCLGALCFRPSYWFFSGHKTQARGCVYRDRIGSLQRVLWGLGSKR